MRTFAELLREYAERTGVSDAELARAVGVRRQTIFRWKEGTVARPRSAEDVVRLAGKLRLSDEERDEFLLAAGFPPVVAAPSRLPASLTLDAGSDMTGAVGDAAEDHAEHVMAPMLAAPAPAQTRLRLLLVLGLVLLGALTAWLLFRPRAVYPVSQGDETLIVVGHFVNYTGGSQGYNIPGRIRQALEREITAARLSNVRVAEWPDPIRTQDVADEVAARSRAALVIWGEYDSGRVLARFTVSDGGEVRETAPLEKLLSTTDDLSAVINSDLPEDTRFLALLNLSQVLIDRRRPEVAVALLAQAASHPVEDDAARVTLYFLTGLAAQQKEPPDLDAAIGAYGGALALRPDLVAASHNRAVACLKRQGAGDVDLALADLTRYLVAYPDAAEALTNRGTAHLLLGGNDHARQALIDLNRALKLMPDSVEALLNRGLARLRTDELGWEDDFERVLVLKPGHPGALESLCWAHAVQGRPEDALPWCEQALSAADSGPARHGRAIAYALTEEYVLAAEDLEAYLAALKPPLLEKEVGRVREWISELRAGRNPFDDGVLNRLRRE